MVPMNYSIRSETFKSDNIRKGFLLLQQQEEFVDVTLAAEGHLVKAHQNILALASPYLKALCQTATSQHPIIFLTNVEKEILSYILEYVYIGEVKVPCNKYVSFIDAAKQMHIVGFEHLGAMRVTDTLDSNKEQDDITSIDLINDEVTVKENRPETVRSIGSINTVEEINLTENTLLQELITCDDNIKNCDLDTPTEKTNREINESHMPANMTENCILAPEVMQLDQNIVQEDTVTLSNDFQLSCSDSYAVKLDKQSTPLDDKTRPLYTMSIRGSLMMILNRFLYNLHHQSHNGHKRRWRCVDYRRKHCLAYVDTKDEIIISRVNSHTHGFHDSKIISTGAKRNIFTSIKQASK